MKKVPLLRLLQNRYPEIPKKELYAAILCGEVTVSGERIRDPKRFCHNQAEIVLSGGRQRFVSRGGEKLEGALKRWDFPVKGAVCLDAGASTGGFTDCLLQHGAKMVHAVDVGYNQLDYSLREDPRVIVHERTNIMDVHRLTPAPELAVADLSFRSLRGAAFHIASLTTGGLLIALAKPQFETQRLRDNDYDGFVRTREETEHILQTLVRDLAEERVSVTAIVPSPLPGRRGNREFLLRIVNRAGQGLSPAKILQAVNEAFGSKEE